ncbi:MAG: hypothetical protein JSV62_10800 [Promethearchaeota archaeon]|nr:MAG: hypothetical protein JSV62_10800 [Candidatus Lokiarchaeota archaeon]
MKIIGTQWKVTEKLKGLKSQNQSENWQITYVTPIYGGWDLLVECKFNNLEDLDEILSYCRTDLDLSQWIEATTTLISTKKNYNG